MRRGPVEPGEDAGERAGEIRHAVGDHRQPGVGKARRVAVGVDDDARRIAAAGVASTRSRIVTPPMPMRALSPPPMRRASPPASDEARASGGLGTVTGHRSNRHAPPPCAGAWRSPPRRRRGPGRTRCGPRRRARRSACRARGRSASGSALRASSTPQAVKPERETRIGMPMRTVLITISEVSRPVV